MSVLPLTPWPVLNAAMTVLLILGGTLRLSRLVTTDALGGWLLRDPVEKWAATRELVRRRSMREVLDTVDMESDDIDPEAVRMLQDWEKQLADTEHWITWQGKLASGLVCPFCVGFWIGVGVSLATLILAPLGALGVIWALFLAVLTLNYIVGHISSRID